jgi:hypothetical protein
MTNRIFLLIVALLFLSCKKSEEFSEDMSIQAIKLPAKVDQVKFVKPEVAKAEEISYEANESDKKIPVEQKIIKIGSVHFETNDLEKTYQQIFLAVKKYKSNIQNDSEGKEYGSIYKRMTVRVPSQNFDLFLNEISQGVTFFDTKEVSVEDVTEQYIDIEARLIAKKRLENRYLELLKKATKVIEILEIEKQLSAIREEIESKQGQLLYLQNQISMSTITIEFYKTVAENEGATISYGSKIWNGIISGFNSFSDFLINLISVWPFLIVLAVVIYGIKKWLKRRAQNKKDL